MSLFYWGEALTSAAYLINRVPSSTIAFKTPSEALIEGVVSPATPNLPPRVFGCVAFIHLHKHQRNKLQPWALRCVFIGYATHQKSYRCYHPPTQKCLSRWMWFFMKTQYIFLGLTFRGSIKMNFRLYTMKSICLQMFCRITKMRVVEWIQV
jgi:hypothetical protein